MSNKKEELKSFQIGMTPSFMPGTGPTMSPAAPAGGVTPFTPSAPTESVFPSLEQLIENENLEEIGKKMGDTCRQLEELAERRTGRIKTEAQKARQAYEHTFDLIDHLMQIKTSMLEKKE